MGGSPRLGVSAHETPTRGTEYSSVYMHYCFGSMMNDAADVKGQIKLPNHMLFRLPARPSRSTKQYVFGFVTFNNSWKLLGTDRTGELSSASNKSHCIPICCHAAGRHAPKRCKIVARSATRQDPSSMVKYLLVHCPVVSFIFYDSSERYKWVWL